MEAVFGRVQGQGGAAGLLGELTTSQLAAKHGAHQAMVGDRKRQAVKGLVTVSSGKTEAEEGMREEEVEKPRAKTGQLVAERVFAEGLRSVGGVACSTWSQ